MIGRDHNVLGNISTVAGRSPADFDRVTFAQPVQLRGREDPARCRRYGQHAEGMAVLRISYDVAPAAYQGAGDVRFCVTPGFRSDTVPWEPTFSLAVHARETLATSARQANGMRRHFGLSEGELYRREAGVILGRI